MIVKLLGVLGNLAFACACVPTAARTWWAQKSIGTPIGLAWNILIACVLFYSYTAITYTGDWLVWIGGVIEIACYCIVIWYHYNPEIMPIVTETVTNSLQANFEACDCSYCLSRRTR